MQVAEPIVGIVDSGDYDRRRDQESSAYFCSVAIAGTFPSKHADTIIRVFFNISVYFSALFPSISALVAVLTLLLISLTEC